MTLRTTAVALMIASTGHAAPAANAETKSHDLPIDGIVLHVEEVGAGKPLVLLHNFGWSGKVWAHLIPELASTYRVLVVDLPGHGGSTGWTEERYHYPRNAKRILGALKAMGVTSLRAIGVSSGAMTALHMAIAEPARVEAMIVSGAPDEFPAEMRKWLTANACKEEPPEQVQKRLAHQRHGIEQVKGLSRMFCHEKDNQLGLTPALLSSVTARTLVAHGDRDRYFPVPLAVNVFQGIRGAHLWVQPGGGHLFLLAETHRSAVLSTIQAFFDGAYDPSPSRK